MAAGNNHPNQQRHERRERRRDNRITDRATNDVQLQMQPQFDYNNAQLQQAQENYLRLMQTAQSASGGAADAISGIQQPHFQAIQDQFTNALNSYAPEFSGAGAGQQYFQPAQQYGQVPTQQTVGMPQNEMDAGNALGGAIGAAFSAGLGNDKSRFQMSQANAEQEANIFGRNQQSALLQNMQDTLQQHENENQNLFSQQPYQIKQRVDELRDQAIEEQLARSKMRSDAAFSQYLQDTIGGMTSGSTRPGGSGPGNHGPNSNLGGNGPAQGQHPAVGGYGDTAAGGNNGTGGGAWAGASDGYSNPRSVMNTVRTADSLSDLPGWVRYAYNHQGANPSADPQVLHNDARRKLYNQKIAPYLNRQHGPTWPKGT